MHGMSYGWFMEFPCRVVSLSFLSFSFLNVVSFLQLTFSVRKHAFDFEKVAQDLQRYVNQPTLALNQRVYERMKEEGSSGYC